MVNTGIETALKISQQVKEANALIISSIKNNTLKAIKFANQGKDVVIQYGNKVKVISRDVALKAGLIVTEGASYVLNKAHQGVQHLNRNLQENLQAGKDGVSL